MAAQSPLMFLTNTRRPSPPWLVGGTTTSLAVGTHVHTPDGMTIFTEVASAIVHGQRLRRVGVARPGDGGSASTPAVLLQQSGAFDWRQQRAAWPLSAVAAASADVACAHTVAQLAIASRSFHFYTNAH
jgi:hypothetical protein